MKRLVPASLLMSGCISAAFGAPVALADANPSVEIIAESLCTFLPPKVVVLHGAASGLMPPLRFHWFLGNGKEWDGPEVPEQEYEVGRYDVVLAVSDAAGRMMKASVAIEAEAHGCGGR
jgi:hypothetical protein